MTPGAGSSAGLMFMPQIDDEVLVGFEHGNLRRPFVLGGVWGAKAKPPTAAETRRALSQRDRVAASLLACPDRSGAALGPR